MENRFGVKDFILFILIGVLIVMVAVAMKQYDRQWDDVQSIKAQVAALRGKIEDGGWSTRPGTRPSTNPSDYPKDDPFGRVRAAQAMPGYAKGDWVVEAVAQIATLTPFVSSDLYARYAHDLVLESLATRDPVTLEWQPLLAAELPKIEDRTEEYDAYIDAEKKKGRKEDEIAKDPKLPVPVTITYTLRAGTRFSDGQPVTADDVVWSFNWIMDERVAAARERSAFEKVRSVEKKGDNQVVFKFKEPYYDVMTLSGTMYVLPKHFYGKYKPEEFNQSVGLLLGSGPYRLEDPTNWKAGGGQVVLVRNERYWGVAPGPDRNVLKEFVNDVARQTAFRNGEIDVFEARPEQYHAMRREPELAKRAKFFDWLSLNGGYRYVAWQELRDGKPTVFADKRVRRAMAMLVDRKRMVQEVMLGYAELASGPFSPIGKQYDKSIQPLPYDVEGARKLLDEAGFKDKDGDGVLDGPDGRPFKFKLTYPSGSANYEKMVLAFKDAYAKVGIALTPDPLEWAVFSSKLRNKDFEAISLGWGGGNPESDPYQMFASSQTVTGGDNFMCYINPEFDKAISAARRTVDEKKRIPLWNKCHRILNEDQPYMFLWFTKEMYCVDGRFQNVQTTPLGLTPGLHVEWFVPSASQKWTK
jgi:peptide/nickel transport system substrate-binding protein